MLRRIGFTLLALAIFSIAGGHWILFQTVAWMQMLRVYTQEVSFVEAVTMTFDGNHPCNICTKVKEGRQKEEKAPGVIKVNKKAEFCIVCMAQEANWPDWEFYKYLDFRGMDYAERPDAPPFPVPRNRSSNDYLGELCSLILV